LKEQSGTIRILLSAVSGILLLLCFPKYDLYWIAWFALVPLLYCLSDVSGKKAFLLGIITGLVFNYTLFYWFLSDFLIVYSKLSVYVSFIIYLALGVYLALYYGVFALVINVCSSRLQLPLYLTAPPLFVLLEFIRAKVFTGFPWELLGYSQYNFLPLIQIADITGVYGVSFILVLINSVTAEILKKRFRFTGRLKTVFVIACAFVGLILTYGAVKLSHGNKEGSLFRASIIQGNISVKEKRSKDLKTAQGIIDKYGEMTTRALAYHPDVILWPETAMPFVYGVDRKSSESLLDFQKRLGVPILLGTISSSNNSSSNSNQTYSNSALLLQDGNLTGMYNKVKLVPFGEYVPGGLKLGKIVDNFDFLSGDRTKVFDLNGVKFSVLICYEIIFPEISRNFVANGARVLFTISNDAWFGNTSAPYQHFSMAVFRAIENRVPLVRAANTGVSGFIDESGRVIKMGDIFSQEIYTGEVVSGKGNTFYNRYGDVFVYACIIYMILITLLKFYNRSVLNRIH